MFIVTAMSGVDGHLCFLGCGSTEQLAILDAGGKLKAGQFVMEMSYEEALDRWPDWEMELDNALSCDGLVPVDAGGSLQKWSVDKVLDEINRDRSAEWTPYDANDYVEGWREWVGPVRDGILVLAED